MDRITEQQLRLAKRQLRTEVVRQLRLLSPSQAQTESRSICQHLLASELWMSAQRVGLFAPVGGEVNIWPVLLMGLKQGKQVYLPVFEEAMDGYRFGLCAEVGELRVGRFGILEPLPIAPGPESGRLDLILVPGIAFDRKGRRIGRGKGYYDRLLLACKGIRCGVAFRCQVVEEVPSGPADVCVDWLATADGLMKVER